jgi:hypothetical protein
VVSARGSPSWPRSSIRTSFWPHGSSCLSRDPLRPIREAGGAPEELGTAAESAIRRLRREIDRLSRAHPDWGFLKGLQRDLSAEDLHNLRRWPTETNSQNSVKPADLVGSDAIQLDLAQELETRGYYYERRRGDFRAAYKTQEKRVKAFGENWSDKVIRLPVAAQACAAFFTQIR